MSSGGILSSLKASYRGLSIFVGLIAIWWFITLLGMPRYMLPSPSDVAQVLWDGRGYLWGHTLITATEIIIGFFSGIFCGFCLALLLALSPLLQRWMMPVLVISQAIPMFALAPILVLWFGFGITSKVVMSTIIIFFPVVSSFYDGLARTDPGWLELARTMRASSYAQLRHVRLMAALPALGSGIRVAASVAPIGAVVGEWVGSSAGLGYVMLNANARVQTAQSFAALFILALMAMALWVIVNMALRRLLYWVPETKK